MSDQDAYLKWSIPQLKTELTKKGVKLPTSRTSNKDVLVQLYESEVLGTKPTNRTTPLKSTQKLTPDKRERDNSDDDDQSEPKLQKLDEDSEDGSSPQWTTSPTIKTSQSPLRQVNLHGQIPETIAPLPVEMEEEMPPPRPSGKQVSLDTYIPPSRDDFNSFPTPDMRKEIAMKSRMSMPNSRRVQLEPKVETDAKRRKSTPIPVQKLEPQPEKKQSTLFQKKSRKSLAPRVTAKIEEKETRPMSIWIKVIVFLLFLVGIGMFFLSIAAANVEMKNHHISGRIFCASTDVDVHIAHNLADNEVVGCIPCPKWGFCVGGRLTICEPPYVRSEVYAVCIPDDEVSKKATEVVRALYESLTGQSSLIPLLTCTPPTDRKSLEYISEFYQTYTNDTAGPEVVEKMKELITTQPEDFGIEIKKEQESTFLIVNAIKPSRRCRLMNQTKVFVYEHPYQLFFAIWLILMVWILNKTYELKVKEKIQIATTVTKVKTIIRELKTTTEPEVYERAKTDYPRDHIEKSWEDVMARLALDPEVETVRINGLVTLNWAGVPIQLENARELF